MEESWHVLNMEDWWLQQAVKFFIKIWVVPKF